MWPIRLFNAYMLNPLAARWLGRRIGRKVKVLRAETSLASEERYRRQLRRLVEMLERAGRKVPYYRDLFRHRGFDVGRVARDPRHLRKLPCLTKEIIQEQGDRLLAEDVDVARLHERKTSGSTGVSVSVYYSQEALDWTAAVNRLVLEWAGKKPYAQEVHLASRFPEAFPLKDRLKERVKCACLNRKNIYTASFEDAALNRVWRRLRSIRPYLVQGHPSTMYALADYARRHGLRAKGTFQVFESTGELLDANKRRAIGDVLECRVVDRYGNAEFGVVAYEKSEDRGTGLSLLEPVVWPETMEAEEGHRELVLTALLNDAMPLIRYRTGDLAQVVRDSSGCRLQGLCGRVHDVVSIGGRGYPTHYVQDLLDRLGGIKEFQVVQRAGRRPLLRLVVPQVLRRTEIRERLAGWWGQGLEVEFVELHQLVRRGRLGKFRYVVHADNCRTGQEDERKPAVGGTPAGRSQ